MSKVRTITLARLVREVITLHVEMPDDVDEATVARFLYETSEVDEVRRQAHAHAIMRDRFARHGDDDLLTTRAVLVARRPPAA